MSVLQYGDLQGGADVCYSRGIYKVVLMSVLQYGGSNGDLQGGADVCVAVWGI